MNEKLQKGDLIVWPAENPVVFSEVKRVAKDGSWADLFCCTWAAMWSKRQPLAQLDAAKRPWTLEEVMETMPATPAPEDTV